MSTSTSPAALIDHTLLKPDAATAEIHSLCEEAVECGFASVCIPPLHVPLAAGDLYGSGVQVATVIGFPLGYATPAVKAFEAGEAVAHGAAEVDMVISLGAAREGRLEAVAAEIRQVVETAQVPVKVILECCYFDDALKRELAKIAVNCGAAFVKTSTGFGPGGATVADVRLLADAVGGAAGVKAAGGIRDWQSCRSMLEAGATRIGTSAGVAIMDQWLTAEGKR
ncbi:MAG TPA: deoxyribose-phosphate aldolase [Desulfuromonadales bacterium]|nr:deoxyribose-phosphate aldolase [Desulfuromonadales bacterium]